MNLALFDLDYTLLNGDSDHAWGQFLVEAGVVDGDVFKKKNDEFWAQYKAGTLNVHEYLAFALSMLAGKTPEELKPLHDGYMAKKIEPMVTAAALALVAQHKDDLCAVVTATNSFVTTPIAERFGVPHLIACVAEIADGRYTGKVSGLPSFREGKVTRVEQWLSSLGKKMSDFERCYFYSDSLNDLPLLSVVSHPVAVNPDATLREHALTQGWPILSLH
ncbi:MAG: HAD family hydrolase [Betaproteobacteria bacterium]|nr:HAD family hydrolase [Betaproteobacteria bacterium]